MGTKTRIEERPTYQQQMDRANVRTEWTVQPLHFVHQHRLFLLPRLHRTWLLNLRVYLQWSSSIFL